MPQTDALVNRLIGALSAPGPGRLRKAATLGALEAISEPRFSRLVGMLAQSDSMPAPVLQAVIKWYIGNYNVDTSEMEHPPEHYTSFDAFFTRRLKAGTHTIDPDPKVAVCPVDGRILSFGRVSDGRIEQVKGRDYRLDELLDSSIHADRFKNGHFVTIYLSPRDYHRIHCPVDGRVTGYRYIPGRLYPVNNTGVTNIDGLFAVNERLISFVESKLGEFAVVKVGATNVGMITASYTDVVTNRGQRTAFDEELKKKVRVKRGGELGMFHLGSTVVVVNSNPKVALVPMHAEEYKRMGSPLFRRR